ncbi:Inhibitor of growth protein 1 [Sciurus carolinensis]|uniref:Inhibitor of growth protein 1 n=1 Tax=Sciurus carolinensis TaxID=30640 RepID=A0AA41MID8_SCICA|nr:Inhibitor of growth protein 1 [Sciurus carolinensis]
MSGLTRMETPFRKIALQTLRHPTLSHPHSRTHPRIQKTGVENGNIGDGGSEEADEVPAQEMMFGMVQKDFENISRQVDRHAELFEACREIIDTTGNGGKDDQDKPKNETITQAEKRNNKRSGQQHNNENPENASKDHDHDDITSGTPKEKKAKTSKKKKCSKAKAQREPSPPPHPGLQTFPLTQTSPPVVYAIGSPVAK